MAYKIYHSMKRCLFALMSLMCVSFVSCDDGYRYDDSEIWETIEELRNRITALEKKVEANVTAIQSMVTLGSIKSWDFDVETGKGVITLLDGKTVTIDQTITGYSLITVEIGEDGTYYWAICQDGVSVPLEIDGKKVPVSVTPDLKISDDDEWMISVDGGKTWVATGIEYQRVDEGGEEEPDVVFFTDVQQDGDYLSLVLADGTAVKVEIVGEASIKVAADTMWFSRAGMEKYSVVEMLNVKAYTITEKPEGWKARIEDSYLYVTAPQDMQVSATGGTVKVLALFAAGVSPEILSVEVVYEPSFTLSYANRSVTVTESEHTAEDFNGYVLLGWKSADFNAEAAVAWLNENNGTLVPYSGTSSYELSAIIEDYSLTEDYVVFAAPYLPPMQISQGKMRYEVSDISSMTCKGMSAGESWEFSDISFDSAWLTAVIPVEEYYGGFMELTDWNNYGRDNFLEVLEYDNAVPINVVQYSGPANAFPYGEVSEDINPGREYVAWYIPVKEDKSYTEADFVTYTFTATDVVADGTVAAPEYSVRDILPSGFTADVTPAAGAYKTYSHIASVAAIPETDIETVRYLIDVNEYSTGSAVNTISSNSFNQDDEVYLLAVSVTEDGKYGEIVKEKVALASLTFTDEVGVAVSGISYGLGDVSLTLEFTGDPVSITYYASTYTYFSDSDMERMLALQQYGVATTVEISKLDGPVVLKGLTIGAVYTFYAVVNKDGCTASHLYKYDFTPTSNVDYILSSSADYEYGMPQISGSWGSKTIFNMNVDMPAECQRYWMFNGNAEYFTGDPWTDSDKLVTGQLMDVAVYEGSVSGVKCSYMNSASRIYMVWQDDKNRYHAIYEFDPHTLQ